LRQGFTSPTVVFLSREQRCRGIRATALHAALPPNPESPDQIETSTS
jgi:hypothetical protein